MPLDLQEVEIEEGTEEDKVAPIYPLKIVVSWIKRFRKGNGNKLIKPEKTKADSVQRPAAR